MARVFISYRHVEPDTRVAKYITQYLSLQGHEVFFDSDSIQVGDLWEQCIHNGVNQSGYFIALVSLAYLNSEFIVQKEFNVAARLYKDKIIKRLLQVNLAYDGVPPKAVSSIVSEIQFIKWREEEDTTQVAEKIASILPTPKLFLRGMRNYGRRDKDVFTQLGRESEVNHFIRMIEGQNEPFLIFHGVSGAGKSSFIKAGILPLFDYNSSFIELEESNCAFDFPSAIESNTVFLFFDQFEQSLRKFSKSDSYALSFTESCKEWIHGGPNRKIIFCILDEYRTAFEEMLPGIANISSRFPLLPFTSQVAGKVLALLLKNAQVTFDENVIKRVCAEELIEGVPPRVLPAILQLICQYFYNNAIPFNDRYWTNLTEGRNNLFEDHIRESVLHQLTPKINPYLVLQILKSLCIGETRTSFRTISEIALDGNFSSDSVRNVMEVAMLPNARIVIVDSSHEHQEAKYRLVHDLFVPAIHVLNKEAKLRNDKRMRNIVLGVITSLLMLTGLSLFALLRANRDLKDSVAQEKANNLINQSILLRESEGQRALLLSIYSFEYLKLDNTEFVSRSTQTLIDALKNTYNFPLPGILNPSDGVEISSNSKWIVASTNSKTLLWQISGGQPKLSYTQDQDSVRKAKFSSDSKYLVMETSSGLKILNLDSQGVSQDINVKPTEGIFRSDLDFDGSAKWLIGCGYVWSIENNVLLQKYKVGENTAHAFIPGANSLALACETNFIYLDLQTLSVSNIDTIQTDPYEGILQGSPTIEASRTGKWIVFQAPPESPKVFEIVDHKIRFVAALHNRSRDYISCIGFSFKDKYLLAETGDGSEGDLLQLDLNQTISSAAWKTIGDTRLTRSRFIDNYKSKIKFVLDELGENVAIIGDFKASVLNLKNVDSAPQHFNFPERTVIAACLRNGQLLISTEGGKIFTWDISIPGEHRIPRTIKCPEQNVNLLEVSPDISFFLSAEIQQPLPKSSSKKEEILSQIRIWNVKNGVPVFPKRFQIPSYQVPQTVLFSTDSKWLFTSESRNVTIWKFNDRLGEMSLYKTISFDDQQYHVEAICNKWAAIASDSIVSVYSLVGKSKMLSLEQKFFPTTLFFSESGNWLLASDNSSFCLWDMRDPDKVRCYDRSIWGGEIQAVRISDDDKYICIGKDDGTVMIFDIFSKGMPLRLDFGLRFQSQYIGLIVFDKITKTFLTASNDGTIFSWNTIHKKARKVFDLAKQNNIYKNKLTIREIIPGEVLQVILFDANQDSLYLSNNRTNKILKICSFWTRISAKGNYVAFTAIDSTRLPKTTVYTIVDGSLIMPNGLMEQSFKHEYFSEPLIAYKSKLILSSDDNIIRIRNLDYLSQAEKKLDLTINNESPLIPLAFSPGNDWLISFNDSNILIWPMNLTYLKNVGLAAAGRDLTPLERELYNVRIKIAQ